MTTYNIDFKVKNGLHLNGQLGVTSGGTPNYGITGQALVSAGPGLPPVWATPSSVTVSDAPPPTPNTSDLWWNSTIGTLKIYYNDGNSSQWVDAVATVQGPVGYTGSQGMMGYTGSAAQDGVAGFTGSAGTIGYTGSQGIVGYTGSIGASGAAGFTGSTGFTGSQGIQGDIGYTGSQGATGFTGSVGATGATGFTGSQGVIGFTGSQGNIGYTGSVPPDVVYKTGDTMTGNLTMVDPAIVLKTTINGTARWMQQDGSGRQHWYWNTAGTTSPTYEVGGEGATDIMMTSDATGGEVFTFRAASGVGKNAGDPITWETVFTATRTGVFQFKSKDVITTGTGWLGVGSAAGKLGGIPLAYDCERSGVSAVGDKLSYGNGTTASVGIVMPFAGKLIAATAGGTGVTGTWTTQVSINGVNNVSYQLSITGTGNNPTQVQNWQSSPLSFAAGSAITWSTTAAATAATALTVTYYVIFD